MSLDTHTESRVTRSKSEAKKSYDKMSTFYDFFSGFYEKKYTDSALKRLKIAAGEKVLEIGFGTGVSLAKIAQRVGEEGTVYGIDISSKMVSVSQRRLEKAGLLDRVELICGDAMKMPYAPQSVDAVFLSFTLELFDSPEIPQLLAKIQSVLKPEGRLGVVHMSKKEGASLWVRWYEWMHEKFPRYVDCRPIDGVRSIKEAGFEIEEALQYSLFGLPVSVVIARKGKKKS